MYSENLLPIFNRRFHGAVNIKGIDFQILYSLYCSLEILEPNSPFEKITLEGIEDFDLKPFHSDNIYFQVKTSGGDWTFSNLANPIKNFIQLNKESSKLHKFQLILNFEPRESIRKLFELDSINEPERLKLKKAFFSQKEIKSISEKEVLGVLDNCEIKHISRENLENAIKQKLVLVYDIFPETADLFLLSFAYQFIEWAIERKTVTKYDLQSLYINFEENIQRKTEFEAYGKSLISRIDTSETKHKSDYFEGKKTRFGDIAVGLDVKRPKWGERIKQIFEKTNTCIIKEASGQGKSTLAFRFINDNWNINHTYVVKVAETAKDAEQIANYFKSIARLGLPISVLIDDIKSELQYYSQIIENCAGYNIPFLITTRNDDYYSFTKSNLFSAKFITPYFDLDEAKKIFLNLKKENRIHENIASAESAFERIASHKSLIEFIYLITQGQMLHERLSGQIKLIKNAEKKDFLRKVILADVCKTPLNLNNIILHDDNKSLDYQELIQELNHELIEFEDGQITGYHWVRSKNLLAILHENYLNPALTALQTISFLEESQIEEFVGNLAEIENFDTSTFINGLNTTKLAKTLNIFLPILRGIFKAGEVNFIKQNKNTFDEAYTMFGENSIFFITASCLPTTKLSLFETLVEVSNGDKNISNLKEISEKIIGIERGFDLVKKVVSICNDVYFSGDLKNVGELIDWFYWIKYDSTKLLNIIGQLVETDMITVFHSKIEDFSIFSQGFYRNQPQKYEQWFNKNKNRIIEKIQHDLDCIIDIKDDIISVEYSKIEESESLNESTMKRLNIIRSAIPFCKIYKGRNSLMLIVKELTGFDESLKEIPVENLHYKSDLQKNKITSDIVKDGYRVKTWFEFLQYYYILRQEILDYSCKLHLKGKKQNFNGKDAPYISDKIIMGYKNMPIRIDDEDIKSLFNDCLDIFNSYNNFLLMKSNFVQNNNDEEAKKLTFINYNNFLLKHHRMQEFFKEITYFAPSYFDFDPLSSKENRVFPELKELLKNKISASQQYWELNTII